MDSLLLALNLAVLLGALLQAASGIGFGVIAGPMILIALNDGSAIQVTSILSLLIAVVLLPSVLRHVERAILRRFLIGSLAGLPLGLAAFIWFPVAALKLLAGFSILLLCLMLLRRRASGFLAQPGAGLDHATGVVSGAMSVGLAMPGPVAAVRLTALTYPKEATRATILLLFVFSYSVAIAAQAAANGLSGETLRLSLGLVPATLIGIGLGALLSRRLSERWFHRVILTILLVTAVSLLLSASGASLG